MTMFLVWVGLTLVMLFTIDMLRPIATVIGIIVFVKLALIISVEGVALYVMVVHAIYGHF